LSDPDDESSSASISRVSAKIRRRFASGSSSPSSGGLSPPPLDDDGSGRLPVTEDADEPAIAGVLFSEDEEVPGIGAPLSFA
jgi:hypothetical protein